MAARALFRSCVPRQGLLSPIPSLSSSSRAWVPCSVRPVTGYGQSPRGFSSASATGTLVLADFDGDSVSAATLSAVTAARALQAPVTLAVLASSVEQSERLGKAASCVTGVSKVVTCTASEHADDVEHAVAETTASLIADIQKQNSYSHIIGASNSTGKNVLFRLGAVFDVQPISDVISIESADTFKRPVYAGNALATVQSADAVKILSVRTTAFDKTDVADEPQAGVESVSPSPVESPSHWVSDDMQVSERPELSSARVVVSGGRGVKSKENFKIIEDLADALGGAVGASRAAVDAGYAPNDMQVGQTGKVVAPDLYIAAGISGAIQHLAGMKDSKTIVAINKDPEAPIFQVSDYGLVADLFKAVPEMTEKVKA